MGAITGAVLADALRSGAMTETARPTWCNTGVGIANHAEAHLRGAAVPVDLIAVEAVAVAVGLAKTAPPLLVEPATVEVLDLIGGWLSGADAELPVPMDTVLADAWAGRHRSFAEAIDSASTEPEAVLAGATVGLCGGIGALPARLVSEMRTPDDRPARRYLARLTDRLLGLHRHDWYDPRNRRGPREVLPGVWLSNLYGLGSFTVEHPDGLVISLCDIEGRLDDHDHQITFHIDDTPKTEANPSIELVLDGVLAEVEAARSAGQPVLVHCRHGASRTGLVLRLLLVEEHGLDAEAALMEAQCIWPHTSTWNRAWARQVERYAELSS